jgi:hypothetical protein
VHGVKVTLNGTPLARRYDIQTVTRTGRLVAAPLPRRVAPRERVATRFRGNDGQRIVFEFISGRTPSQEEAVRVSPGQNLLPPRCTRGVLYRGSG